MLLRKCLVHGEDTDKLGVYEKEVEENEVDDEESLICKEVTDESECDDTWVDLALRLIKKTLKGIAQQAGTDESEIEDDDNDKDNNQGDEGQEDLQFC